MTSMMNVNRGQTPMMFGPETPMIGGPRTMVPRMASATLFQQEFDEHGAYGEGDDLSEDDEDDFASSRAVITSEGNDVVVRVFGPETTILRQKIGQTSLRNSCTHELFAGTNYIDFLVDEDVVERLVSQNNQLVDGYIIGVQRLASSRRRSVHGRPQTLRSDQETLSSIFCTQPEGLRLNMSLWSKILHYIF